jgi:hypothetical protein
MTARRHAALRQSGPLGDFLRSTGIRPVGDGIAKQGNRVLFFGRITPSAADKILKEYNSHNRLRREGRVTGYAQSMKDKEWADNCVPILFDENGQLLDGQHRLEGCVVSKKALVVSIAFGVPFQSFTSLDRGGKRKLPDDLHTLGFAWAPDRAKIANLLYREMNDNLLVTTRPPKNPPTDVGLAIATGDEMGDAITRALHFVYGFSHQWKPKKLFERSEAAFFFMKLEPLDQPAGVEYLHHLISGQVPPGSSAEHICTAVRNRLIAIDRKDKDAQALRLLAIHAGWQRFCTSGNGVVRDYRVKKLRDQRTGNPRVVALPEFKTPTRRVKTATAAWFLEHSNFDGIMTSGQRRAEQFLERGRIRQQDTATRAERMREKLVDSE